MARRLFVVSDRNKVLQPKQKKKLCKTDTPTNEGIYRIFCNNFPGVAQNKNIFLINI